MWWCPNCKREVPSEEVTFCETHDTKLGGCGLVVLPRKGENQNQQIKTIDVPNSIEFEQRVNDLLKEGYEILSTNCGFANSEKYDFCGCWQAILVKR
jgi:hypothetical protein